MNSLQSEKVQIIKDLRVVGQSIAASNYSQVYVLVDENTNIHCLPLLQGALVDEEVYFFYLEVPAGEQSKDISTCTSLWESLSEDNADRKTLMVNLGGGMLTDLGAFVAACYKRGIDFYHVPTSLLAMVDAAIGGKCGIDFGNYKNQIGVFQEAQKTFVFPEFLKTLPDTEFWSGMGEVFKHALIADADYWSQLKSLSGRSISMDQIEKSIRIKQHIVEADPKEQGGRKKLNFGHTIGHAMESYFLEKEKPIPHGFAVAAGMICEAHISVQLNLISLPEYDDVEETLNQFFDFPTVKKSEFPELLHFMQQDKKNENDQINFTLLSSIGNATVNQAATEQQIITALDYFFGYD
jgi:3-dehydroquinate synthase